MWRFLTVILISGLVGLGVWGALHTGLVTLPTKAAPPQVEVAPTEVPPSPESESSLELLSPHSARASLGHLAAISVTLQLPNARGEIISVTVPVEVELNLDLAVSGGRAGILGYQQQTIPVVAVQSLLNQHLLTSMSTDEVLRPAQAAALIPTPTPTLPRAPTQSAPPSVTYNVNMRSEPDATSQIVGKIYPGDTFALVGRNTDASWYRVMHSDGATGWIAAYLVQGGPAPETLAVALDTQVVLAAGTTPSP